MRLIVLTVSLAAALSGCALRPRYADFVTSTTEGKELTFLVTDAATGQPVPNARVELSELRNRLQLTSAADGTFKVPVEKKYLEENPVFVVSLPRGLAQYRLSLAPAVVKPTEEQAPAPEAIPDAGTPASNG